MKTNFAAELLRLCFDHFKGENNAATLSDTYRGRHPDS